MRELCTAMGPRKKLASYIRQQQEEQQQSLEVKLEAETLKGQRALAEEEKEGMCGGMVSQTSSGRKVMQGVAGTGQMNVQYPLLSFSPRHLFAVGSPIGLFLTVR